MEPACGLVGKRVDLGRAFDGAVSLGDVLLVPATIPDPDDADVRWWTEPAPGDVDARGAHGQRARVQLAGDFGDRDRNVQPRARRAVVGAGRGRHTHGPRKRAKECR